MPFAILHLPLILCFTYWWEFRNPDIQNFNLLCTLTASFWSLLIGSNKFGWDHVACESAFPPLPLLCRSLPAQSCWVCQYARLMAFMYDGMRYPSMIQSVLCFQKCLCFVNYKLACFVCFLYLLYVSCWYFVSCWN
jgi:hypothetical protein